MSLFRSFLLCCTGFALCLSTAAAQQQVVLVTSSASTLNDLDSLQLRKIYLGFEITHAGTTIKALRNNTDGQLDQIFLQTVVAMSERAYTRRQLSLTLRQGTPRVAEFDNLEKLFGALGRNPNSVTYMWRADAERRQDIKILRVLWERQ